jgi:subtilisin family serine protease
MIDQMEMRGRAVVATGVRRRWQVLGSTIMVTGLLSVGVAAPAQAAGEIRNAGGITAVAESYIVVLKDSVGVAATSERLLARYGGTVAQVYQAAFKGFELRVSERDARRLAADPAVAFVEQNHRVQVQASGVQLNPPSWGLDRIDQRNLPLNQRFAYPNTGSHTHAYVIDTGIRASHVDFTGRVLPGRDVLDPLPADDCNGHGTALAGVIGGRLHGVAKEVRLVPVRVLNCAGSGTFAQVIAGIDWVTANAVRPAVALLALGGGPNTALDTAVTNSFNSGIAYVVTSGSSNANACNYSPARVPVAITVSGTTQTDARIPSGNYGSCLDIYAPGASITTTWYTSNTAVTTISGSSFAAAHTAGCVALQPPSAFPPGPAPALIAKATLGVLTGVPAGTPNRLLYCGA